MPILFISKRATQEEIGQMTQELERYVKVAVDTAKGVLAGGGVLHADCEAVLIQKGSRQEDIWGADWYPDSKEIEFKAMINIAPRRGNRSMEIKDPAVRKRLEGVVRNLLG